MVWSPTGAALAVPYGHSPVERGALGGLQVGRAEEVGGLARRVEGDRQLRGRAVLVGGGVVKREVGSSAFSVFSPPATGKITRRTMPDGSDNAASATRRGGVIRSRFAGYPFDARARHASTSFSDTSANRSGAPGVPLQLGEVRAAAARRGGAAVPVLSATTRTRAGSPRTCSAPASCRL
ncbi:hypothetical protein ABZ502_34505 [Streptomyces abikoensis]|uniref:hypothetical protein n=1 Tax=Streptomyces TaxID=1883 RepID=UPI0033CA064E